MKQVRKIYDKAFKEKAVQLSYERTNILKLARELGVTAPQLYKWRKVLQVSCGSYYRWKKQTITARQQRKIAIKEKIILIYFESKLKQLIKEVIKEEFIDFKNNLDIKESEVLLTRSETCELLKIDSSTLWSWTKKGKITCYGIAARRYYKRDEILNCLVVLKQPKS